MSTLDELKVDELRAEARARGFTRVGRLARAALLSQLEAYEALAALEDPDLLRLAKAQDVEGAAALARGDLLLRLAEVGARPEAEAPPPSPADRARGDAAAAWVRRRTLASGALRTFGAAGVVLSLVAMLIVPLATLRIVRSLQGGLASAARQVGGVADLLETAQGGLDEAASSLRASSTALAAVQSNLEDVEPLLNTVGSVVGEQAPATVEATRQALIGAEAGAAAIDQALRAATFLSPLTGFQYNPAQPLDQSLAEAAAGLEPLPGALRGVQTDMKIVTADVIILRLRLGDMSAQLGSMAKEIGGLSDALGAQAQSLGSAADGLEAASRRVPFWGAVCGGLTLVLLAWLALTQYAVYIVGDGMRPEAGPSR